MLTSPHSSRLRRDADGFTLIELLIVVIIIGLLAAIALPAFLNSHRQAVDASVKADVHNTVTNIAGSQAQKLGTAKAAISRDDTNVALSSAAGDVFATRSAPDLTIPESGVSYTLQGWNAGGLKYLGTAAAGAFRFDSASGLFTQSTTAAPDPGAAQGDGGSGTNPVGGSNTAPTFTSAATAPDGSVGQAYPGFTVVATARPAATFTAPSSGATRLPDGLVLNTTSGAISGTPNEGGKFSVKVTATNTAGSTDQSLSLTVTAAPAATNAGTLPEGFITVPYSARVQTSGYPAPTFTKETINGVTLATDGTLSGTPAGTGNYQFTGRLTNSVGSKDTNFVIKFSAPPAASCDFNAGASSCAPKISANNMYGTPSGRNGTPGVTANAGSGYIGFTGYNFGMEYFKTYRISVWTNGATPYSSAGGTSRNYAKQEVVDGWTRWTQEVSGDPYTNFAMFFSGAANVDDVSITKIS